MTRSSRKPSPPGRTHRGQILALPALLAGLALSCSGGAEANGPQPSSAAGPSLPDPAEAGLVSPEEAAQAAEEAIDPSNAEAELERLRREIGEG